MLISCAQHKGNAFVLCLRHDVVISCFKTVVVVCSNIHVASHTCAMHWVSPLRHLDLFDCDVYDILGIYFAFL